MMVVVEKRGVGSCFSEFGIPTSEFTIPTSDFNYVHP
jgi:hypothetical protein